jgi:hypothetical protein
LRVEEVGSGLKGWRTRGPHRAVQRLLSRRENPLSRRKSSCVVLGEEVLEEEDGCHWSSIHWWMGLKNGRRTRPGRRVRPRRRNSICQYCCRGDDRADKRMRQPVSNRAETGSKRWGGVHSAFNSTSTLDGERTSTTRRRTMGMLVMGRRSLTLDFMRRTIRSVTLARNLEAQEANVDLSSDVWALGDLKRESARDGRVASKKSNGQNRELQDTQMNHGHGFYQRVERRRRDKPELLASPLTRDEAMWRTEDHFLTDCRSRARAAHTLTRLGGGCTLYEGVRKGRPARTGDPGGGQSSRWEQRREATSR